MFQDDAEAWQNASSQDLWIFDKLLLSHRLGYSCGPAGVNVPTPGQYCVRPITNISGMGIGASIQTLFQSTDHLPPGTFWCEQFTGPHLSVDYHNKHPVLSVQGIRAVQNPLWQWDSWKKAKETVDFPEILNELVGDYPIVNCEFIGGRLIEVHLRGNPDFRYGNTEAIPIWDRVPVLPRLAGYKFVHATDYKRRGLLVK